MRFAINDAKIKLHMFAKIKNELWCFGMGKHIMNSLHRTIIFTDEHDVAFLDCHIKCKPDRLYVDLFVYYPQLCLSWIVPHNNNNSLVFSVGVGLKIRSEVMQSAIATNWELTCEGMQGSPDCGEHGSTPGLCILQSGINAPIFKGHRP